MFKHNSTKYNKIVNNRIYILSRGLIRVKEYLKGIKAESEMILGTSQGQKSKKLYLFYSFL